MKHSNFYFIYKNSEQTYTSTRRPKYVFFSLMWPNAVRFNFVNIIRYLLCIAHFYKCDRYQILYVWLNIYITIRRNTVLRDDALIVRNMYLKILLLFIVWNVTKYHRCKWFTSHHYQPPLSWFSIRFFIYLYQ